MPQKASVLLEAITAAFVMWDMFWLEYSTFPAQAGLQR
jgi:hypothetical protein